MRSMLKNNSQLLKSDYVMVSDGEIYKTTPLIEASLRGGFNMKIVVKTGNTDLHSGDFGGGILNAGTVIANLVSGMVDSENNVLVNGFEKGVDAITEEQKENTNKMETPTVKSLTLSEDENFLIKTALKPTIQVTGMKTGYTGEGFNNIVPGIAEVRINVRIVASQDADEVEAILNKFIKEHLPNGIEYEILVGGKHNPIKLNVNSQINKKTQACLERAFNKAPLITYVGGAMPFVTDVKNVYNMDTLLVPLGNDNNNSHGPNENYSLDIINKGFSFSLDFFTSARD